MVRYFVSWGWGPTGPFSPKILEHFVMCFERRYLKQNSVIRLKSNSLVLLQMLLQPLRWCCVDCVIHHERDVREEQHHTYMWLEQAIIEWSWRESPVILTMWTIERNNSVREEWSWHVNSIVACCHSAKLCACAARDFRSLQYPQMLLVPPNFFGCLRYYTWSPQCLKRGVLC